MKQIIYEIKDVQILNLIALTYGKTFEDASSLEGMPLDAILTPINAPTISIHDDKFFMSYREDDRLVYPKINKDFIFLKAMNGSDTYLNHMCKGLEESCVREVRMSSFFNDKSSKNGFFGAAFKNTKTKEIIIVYRGTNDIVDWVSDIKLGVQKTHSDQLLEANYFYEYIKENYNKTLDNKIIVVGHSLGGCLAQFVYATNVADEVCCKTFNALGINCDDLGVDNFVSGAIKHGANKMEPAISNEIMRLFREESIIMSDMSIDPVIIYDRPYAIKKIKNIYARAVANYNGITNVIEKDSKLFPNLKISFGFGKKKNIPKKILYDATPSDSLINEILDTLTIYIKFRGYFKMKDVCDDNCLNYIFEKDLVSRVSKHIGYVINICRKTVAYHGSAVKTWEESDIVTILKKGKITSNHSICNFLLFLDGRGYLNQGYVRYAFSSNIFLSYIYKRLNDMRKLTYFNLEMELMLWLNKIRKDDKYFEGFVFGKYYMSSLKNMEPYYKQGSNQFVLGVKQNCLFDGIKSSKPVILSGIKTNKY